MVNFYQICFYRKGILRGRRKAGQALMDEIGYNLSNAGKKPRTRENFQYCRDYKSFWLEK